MNKKLLLVLPFAFALGACAGTGGMGSADYSPNQVRQAASVQTGVIQSVRHVQIAGQSNTSSMVAPTLGAIIGGLLGNQIGQGSGHTAAMALGGIAGGFTGNAVGEAAAKVRGIELIVQLAGRAVAITQADDGTQYRVGQQVTVLGDYGSYRVTPL